MPLLHLSSFHLLMPLFYGLEQHFQYPHNFRCTDLHLNLFPKQMYGSSCPSSSATGGELADGLDRVEIKNKATELGVGCWLGPAGSNEKSSLYEPGAHCGPVTVMYLK